MSQVRRELCAFLMTVLIGAGSRAETMDRPCFDANRYSRAVVSISHKYEQPVREAGREYVGERATAWFFTSPRFLVTAAHFAKGLPLRRWDALEIHTSASGDGSEATIPVQARLVRVGNGTEANGLKDDVAILELNTPFPGAAALDIQLEPPANDQQVVVLGYPGGALNTATGIVRAMNDSSDRYAGLTLLEVQGSNRLLLNAGASGAPVIDCARGRVVAVLSGLLTGRSLPFLPPDKVVPTPWGSPTNTAVPASVLTAIYE